MVDDFHAECQSRDPDIDPGVRAGPAVLEGVGERFLHDAVGDQLQPLGYRELVDAGDGEGHRQAGVADLAGETGQGA